MSVSPFPLNSNLKPFRMNSPKLYVTFFRQLGQISTQINKTHLRIFEGLELAQCLSDQRRNILVDFAILGQFLALSDFEHRKKRLNIADALRFICDLLHTSRRRFNCEDVVSRLVLQVSVQRILFSFLPQLLNIARDDRKQKNFNFKNSCTWSSRKQCDNTQKKTSMTHWMLFFTSAWFTLFLRYSSPLWARVMLFLRPLWEWCRIHWE